jgi:hypothetical protein
LTRASQSILSQHSGLTIFSEGENSFYLFLNRVRQNTNPAVNIRVDFLKE